MGGCGVRVCGVIAEYDPFHRGHAYHLAAARERSGADYVLCVMSGSFTQRGAPALLPVAARAEMALRNGADVVLLLPYAFSVREAEYFALGGVGVLQALGCVTHMAFGCEEAALPYFGDAAALLEEPDADFQARRTAGLAAGQSFAAAQGAALCARLGTAQNVLNAPNAALAIAYLRALRRLKCAIEPVPVARQAAYHSRELSAMPSATALRGAILRGDWPGVRAATPDNALPIVRRAVAAGEICPPEALTPALRQLLLAAAPEALSRLPGMGEGLEMRVAEAAKSAVSREELIYAVKTRRYTYGRISRALCHALMGVTKDMLPERPAYTRLLGFRAQAAPLLRAMRGAEIPVYQRPAREAAMALDIRADELWRVGAGLPRGETYRRAPVIVR